MVHLRLLLECLHEAAQRVRADGLVTGVSQLLGAHDGGGLMINEQSTSTSGCDCVVIVRHPTLWQPVAITLTTMVNSETEWPRQQ